jgi:type IV pilus assembly protein PilC
VAKAAGNKVVEKAVFYARDRISEGRNMSEPLQSAKIFPGMVVQMIAVGEQTGALDIMCNKIADFYDEEVDVAVSAMTSALEPIMMVVIGTVVGGMVIAMYLPVFELAGAIQ